MGALLGAVASGQPSVVGTLGQFGGVSMARIWCCPRQPRRSSRRGGVPALNFLRATRMAASRTSGDRVSSFDCDGRPSDQHRMTAGWRQHGRTPVRHD